MQTLLWRVVGLRRTGTESNAGRWMGERVLSLGSRINIYFVGTHVCRCALWAKTDGGPWKSCTITPTAPLLCHPVPKPTALHPPSLRLPNPRKNSHPTPAFRLAKSNSQFLPSILFFLMVSEKLDEQSPLLCLPGLAHILIRSCRYPDVICLVSTSTQMRLANRCVLQLSSLRQTHLRALTRLPEPGSPQCQLLPPARFQHPVSSGTGWGDRGARTHLPSPSSRISSQGFLGFSRQCQELYIKGWGSGKCELVRGKRVRLCKRKG